MRLTDTIRSADDLQQQYQNSSNLNARSAIYRFAGAGGWGPEIGFNRMLQEISANADLLELGCGPGGLWRNRIERVPRNWRLLLTDLMPGMVAEAAAALANDARFRVRQMDAHKIDSPDRSFDAVVANHMLYHVEDRPRALAEIHRVLRPGGILFAATNSESHLSRFRELLDEFLGPEAPVELREMPFSLENGESQLRPYFQSIDIQRGRSELRITDADAVVQYILSAGRAKESISPARQAQLRQRIQREIDERGAFVEHADAGMFIAT